VTFHGTLRAARGADNLRDDVFRSKLAFEQYFLACYSDEPSTPTTARRPQHSADDFFDIFADNVGELSAPQQELNRFFALRTEKYGTSRTLSSGGQVTKQPFLA
jgi:hypothetical protein